MESESEVKCLCVCVSPRWESFSDTWPKWKWQLITLECSSERGHWLLLLCMPPTQRPQHELIAIVRKLVLESAPFALDWVICGFLVHTSSNTNERHWTTMDRRGLLTGLVVLLVASCKCYCSVWTCKVIWLRKRLMSINRSKSVFVITIVLLQRINHMWIYFWMYSTWDMFTFTFELLYDYAVGLQSNLIKSI